jgi:hypothetical protein
MNGGVLITIEHVSFEVSERITRDCIAFWRLAREYRRLQVGYAERKRPGAPVS